MKKYKILFTIPNFDTAGSGKAMLKLAQRLNPDIFEPHIACLHDKGEFFKTVKESGIPVHIYPYCHSMNNRSIGFWKSFKNRNFFKPYDLVHSFHYADDYSEALSCRLAGTKWCYVKKNMNWNSNAWKLRTRLATGIIAQNTDMIQHFFPDEDKVMLIPRGVDTSEFSPRQKNKDIYTELNLADDSEIILMVANLVPIKGAEFLIEGFKAIIENHPKAILLIVGDDKSIYGDQLKHSVQKEIADRKIIFTGKRSDIKDLQSVARVFVLPTLNKGRQEGSPVSLLEAMASGTYVLASDVAGIRDQLSDIKEQLFAPGNAEAIRIKLEHALGLNEQDRAQAINKQLQIIQQRYTIEHEVALHESFYKRILGLE